MSPSLLLLVVFTPSAAALLVRLVQRPKLGRAIANASVLATLLLSGMLALAVGAHPEEGLHWTSEALALPGARWSFGVDALGAPFLPLASAIASIVLIAGPRHELDREAIVTLLLTLSGILGVMASFDLLQLALFWVASLVPGSLDLRRRSRERPTCRASRVYDIFLVLGAIPMIATVALVGVARAGAGAAWLFELGPRLPPLAHAHQAAVFAAVVIAVIARKAVFPLHSWLPVLVERGPLGVSAMTIGTHLGAFLVLRVALPLAPEAATRGLPLFAALALLSALYAAFLALGQTSLLRALGFVLTSQLGLVVVGLAGENVEALHGAMLTMLSTGLGATGLLIVAKSIEARFGTTDLRELGGLVARFPRMAASFFLLSIFAIGVPGTLGYVAEDLLLHGLLHGHVVLATAMLVVTVLSGVVLLRAYFTIFLGPERKGAGTGRVLRDLLPRESLALGAIVLALTVGGLYPQRLLDLRAPSVEHLVDRLSAHGP